MSEVPGNLLYTSEHEWLRPEAGGEVVIGITDHAQQQLGELVYVELPEAGQQVSGGDGMAVVESTKAASDVYAPLAGEVLAVNALLASQPELVNSQPYADGWLVRLRPADAGALDKLLTPAAYADMVREAGD